MNSNLNKAKKAKYDEFYTQLKDIELELRNYTEQLENKVIYCNCDNPAISNFYLYFKINFNYLKLKHLYCTGYNPNGNGYYAEYDGNKEIIKSLNDNGDFRSDECKTILSKADIVITNPPFSLFSLFREYVAQLMEYGKKFLIIGNANAITYKEIFPSIKNNELWLGYKGFSGGMDFIAGNNYDESKCLHPKYDDKGNIIINVMMCVWFTNIPHINTKQLILTKTYNPIDYPQYDNYMAINVDKVKDIPMDYDGVMGVPITFLQYYTPKQFEFVDAKDYTNIDKLKYKSTYLINGKDTAINGKPTYARILIRKK